MAGCLVEFWVGSVLGGYLQEAVGIVTRPPRHQQTVHKAGGRHGRSSWLPEGGLGVYFNIGVLQVELGWVVNPELAMVGLAR